MPRSAIPNASLKAALEAAASKKAEDPTILDLRGLSDVTDYFLICHGRSGRQVQTISDSIESALLAHRKKPKHIEGYAHGEWILMDFLEFVVHIFTEERREYYGLERLWADAPRLPIGSAAGGSRGRKGGRAAAGGSQGSGAEAES
jgi:ribosome-associated protein